MDDFSLDFEWIDPLGAKGAELRATWARLSIVVDGYPVTRVYDDRSKTVRDAVYLPLYPLAEWLVTQWWPLWNEPGPPLADRPGYDTRHSLVSAREGYALPPLRIHPAGSMVMLSWSPELLTFHGLEFQGRGAFWTKTSLVKAKFSSLITAVVGRLENYEITDTLMQQDWEAIQSADPEEKKFCRCAGSLGLDPYSLDENQQQEIEKAADRLPEEMLTEFFRAARRTELIADAEEIRDAFSRAQSNEEDLTSLRELRHAAEGWIDFSGSMPWEQGYSFAQRMRTHLGLNGAPLKSIKTIAHALGTTEESLSKVMTKFSDRETPFVALMGVNAKLSPVFVTREARTTAHMFYLCRALFEYLASSNQRGALITEANTEQQKRNRAFAAELLAPASALRARIRIPIITWDQAEEVAEEFGVSAYIIRHQLENHHIASVQTYDT
ncbi:hypothetical protein [Desulfomonile tiedjei]|uniref:IrrE N-terminal-like domain-containing protein n=1 Tax=Desulfomonile tiedjei (strain ATCC 49306 / DSM 6799 / DCB-1) TaxID=706587 RepID=I4C246_DESTA|nr:hypothetical protein [Desulfomonile tiedjei]AFM23637.1 hypothetical protein Desti_0918 [Desulfomonile tiedjei DSM 6799]